MTTHDPLVRRAIAAGLVLTLAAGLYLRWILAGVGIAMPPWTQYPFLRHAHSHLGYYAVLLPLAWLAWETSLKRREAWLYAVATVVATVGFVQAGYGFLGITGSTIVGALWLLAALRVTRGVRGHDNPLATVLCGTVAALACIPIIAMSVRANPERAAAAVQSFLAFLLFLVVAPSALAAVGLRQRGIWVLCVAGLGAGLALGLWDTWVTRAALATLGLFWLDAARRMPAPHLVALWGAAGGGLLVVALGVIPLTHNVAVGAIHFLVLGPLLTALTTKKLAQHVAAWAWWAYQPTVVLLAAPLVLRDALPGTWPSITSAVGGTSVLAWWSVVLLKRP